MRYHFSNDKVTIFSYFMTVILAGTLLLSLPFSWNGPGRIGVVDALFTSTSAVCVTGLTVVDTSLYSRFGQLVIMALIQFGGLGIVTFATLYVAAPRSKVSLVNRGIIKEMYIEEVESNPRTIVRNILVSTFGIELAGTLLLHASFERAGVAAPWFTAVFHAVSAFCNAGFSTFPDSLAGYIGDLPVNLVVIMLIVTGGLGFVVLQDMGDVFMRKKRRLAYHSIIVLVMTGALVFFGASAFYVLEYDGAYASLGVPGKMLAALFQSVTPRTAGFETVPQLTLGLPSVAVVILLMFTGGSPGSTAGGVKTTTVFMALAAAFRGPEDDGSLSYHGGALSPGTVARTLSVLAKALVLVCLSFFALLLFEGGKPGASYANLLFESVSAFATVGLSRGLTPSLGLGGKLVIILTMFIGRIGLFAMSVSRPLDSADRFVDYPHESLMLG